MAVQSDWKHHGKGRTPEIVVLCLYMALLGLVLTRHEPWFDEAQAWLLVRDLPYFDLIFHWMRYEGHLPLWHLLLSFPAKMGIPYEWGLKSVNFLCASAAAAVLLLRAPFPRWVRLTLPFTYFLFYQYGVVSRCYSLFMLALWLSAWAFSRRHERPWRLVASLALLGGTTAYGMLIAFAAAVVWFVEIITTARKEDGEGLLLRLLRDRRVQALIGLAAVHVFYVAILWPPADVFTPLSALHLTWVSRLNSVLSAPAEATFLDVGSLVISDANPLWGIYALAICLIAGLLFVLYVRRRLLLGALTLGSLFVFFTFTYYSIHHSGLLWLAVLYLFWLSSGSLEHNRQILEKPPAQRDRIQLIRLGSFAVGCVLAVQVVWCAYSAINDITQPYDSGRDVAAFLKREGAQQYRVYETYESHIDGDRAQFLCPNNVQPYFSGNLFYNFNGGRADMTFITHQMIPYMQALQAMNSLADPPDFIVTLNNGLVPFHDVLPIECYVKVADFFGGHFWKISDELSTPQTSIYIRDDLLARFPELHPLPDSGLDQYKKLHPNK